MSALTPFMVVLLMFAAKAAGMFCKFEFICKFKRSNCATLSAVWRVCVAVCSAVARVVC